MPGKASTALDHLGLVRFLLATTVVIFHSGSAYFPDAGRQAVAGFFCISGFLITKIARETYNERPASFLLNRFLRIYPTYWACLALALLITWYWQPVAETTLPGFGTPDQFGIGNWVNQLTIFSVVPIGGGLPQNFKIIPQSWTLENELYFYLIIGLCTYRSALLTLAAFYTTLFYAVVVLNILPGGFYWSMGSNAFMFFLGSLAYFAAPSLARTTSIRRAQALMLGVALYTLCMYVLPLLMPGYFNLLLLVSPLGMALMLAAMPGIETGRYLWAEHASAYFGRLAYPVFLLHLQAQVALYALLGVQKSPQDNRLLIFAGTYAITLALSVLVVAAVEMPVERLRNRIRILHTVGFPLPLLRIRMIAVVSGAMLLLGTTWAIDYGKGLYRDLQRVTDTKLMRDALRRYHDQFGQFPSPFADANVYSLKAELMDKGFLPTIPNDPLWAATGKQYRYVSHDGQAYGLWIHLEYAQGDIPAGSSCMTGVRHAGTGWYAGAPELNGRQPQECPF